jgi:hypothetical protein
VTKRKSRDPRTDIVYASFTSAGAVMTQDPLALDIARDQERRGLSPDVEEIEATLAKSRAAEQDDAKWEAIIDGIIKLTKMTKQIAAAQSKDWRDPPRVQRKKLAAIIRREVDARADVLKRCGVSNPVAQAEEEAAKRWGHSNGPALHQWLYRATRTKMSETNLSWDKSCFVVYMGCHPSSQGMATDGQRATARPAPTGRSPGADHRRR